MIMDDAKYMAAFLMAAPFAAPANPGVYPAGPFPAGTWKELRHNMRSSLKYTRLTWEWQTDREHSF